MVKIKEAKPRRIPLEEDPLETRNVNYLERILSISKGFKYLNIVQIPPMWTSYCMPTNSSSEPLNEHLPGQTIIKMRYRISEVKKRYSELTKPYRIEN